MRTRELRLKRIREVGKARSRGGNIISCSNWKDVRYCAICPDRIGCDVLGKMVFRSDLWNPSRRKQ